MNRKNQDDLRLLKKARHRIHAMLIVSYLILCLWPAGVYVLLSQPFFSRPDSFTLTFLVSMLVEMVVWMAIFFAVSDGKPKMRHLITFGIVLEFGFVGWILFDMIQNLSFLPIYLIWAALELVKDFYLCWLAGWMKNSWWAKIYFDHTIELSESERIEEARRREQAARARAAAKARAEREAQARAQLEASRQKTSYATQAYRQSHQMEPNSYYAAPDIQQGAGTAPSEPLQAQALQQRAARLARQNAPQAAQVSSPYGSSETVSAAQGIPSGMQQTSGDQAAPSRISDYQTDEELAARTRREEERANRKRLSSAYPRTAVRLALFVYGELILFPVGVHIFQNSFVSMDNSSVFAINLMFTLCILTAVVWTLPIFFLYLKQPGVKKILYGAIALQLAVMGFGAWVLYGYYSTDPSAGVIYSGKVFTLFLILEVIRYGLLLVGILPAFKLPEIRDRHTSKLLSTPQDDQEIYEFELVDEEDPDEFDEETSLDSLLEDEDPEVYADDGYDGLYEEDGNENEDDENHLHRLLRKFR